MHTIGAYTRENMCADLHYNECPDYFQGVPGEYSNVHTIGAYTRESVHVCADFAALVLVVRILHNNGTNQGIPIILQGVLISGCLDTFYEYHSNSSTP